MPLAGQLQHQLGGGFGRNETVGVQAQLAQLAIQRVTLGGHAGQHLVTVGALQQWPAAVTGQTFDLGTDADMQVDHEGAAGHQFAVGWRQHRAGTGGHQYTIPGQGPGQGA